ncbi:Flp pilus assembly protein TadD, contains TPR repeat [Marinobacterium lacunae]|uniref:Flp pilus assembly protein TadD, contains TPR repeat n=1 Tax=Marinobacterium lacunae TaxID=1232683 RepID=A0A081G415_9GAMM|nr:tetratricopeptide repeat protein [Marinobacterium lacunae]KEA65520.1 Flp pilus assembly protein TadD, contains TPR repeat [Marinobacterium lacunae]MBR9883355.1 tetratricopeptide repeat protein [Oceanospirillales bacterium]
MGPNSFYLRHPRNVGCTLLLAAMLTLGGCASQQEQNKTSANDAFYEGKPMLAFTGLPMAKTAQEGVRMGDQALVRGDGDEALYHYVQALELDPRSADAYYRIGQIHYRRDNEKLASLALRSALGIAPEHVGALTAMGVLHLKHNRYREAASYLNKALDKDRARFAEDLAERYDSSSPIDAYNGLGVMADLEGDTAEAQRLYAIALAIRPDAADVHNNLGYSYYLESRWQDAEREFRRALDLRSDYEQAWRNLGLVYARQQRYLSALHALERVMESAKAHNDIGYICMLDGRYQMAEYYFEQALTLSPVFYPKAKENLVYVQRIKEAMAQSAGR